MVLYTRWRTTLVSFTSVLAHKALLEGGAKKKTRQDKALIDTMSATIILTSYMEQQRNLKI